MTTRATQARGAGRRTARPSVVRIAHDFNNILMTIIGHCDLLERGAVASGDAVREIRAAAESAAGLTRQLIVVDAYGRIRRQGPARPSRKTGV